jgi:hypothetical protein
MTSRSGGLSRNILARKNSISASRMSRLGHYDMPHQYPGEVPSRVIMIALVCLPTGSTGSFMQNISGFSDTDK